MFPTNFCEPVSKKDIASPTVHHEETNGEVASAAAPKKVTLLCRVVLHCD